MKLKAVLPKIAVIIGTAITMTTIFLLADPTWGETTQTIPAMNPAPCSEAFVMGAAVNDRFADHGCLTPEGTIRVPLVEACKDGRRLVEMGELIAFVGEKPYNVKNQPMLKPVYDVQCKRGY